MSAKLLILFFVSSLLDNISIAQFSGCHLQSRPREVPSRCDKSERYRTISGWCNNLANPSWGSKGTTLKRLLPAAYEDGRSEPRGGRHPTSLPNPRWISQRNHPDSDEPDNRFTHMVMQFGQFLDHDLTLAPKDETKDCCTSGVQDNDCFTIPIPNPDRFYSWVNNTAKCLNFVRSTPICRVNVREQFNELTAYIDASMVYGSDQEMGALLRTYRDGRLHHNSRTEQLPTREQLNVRPNTRLLKPEKPEDFMAGDMRVNEHPFLTSLHVVFLKEHNRIAKRLREYLPRELQKDEIIYQETRRLVGAEMQNIVYGEYLPTILGVDFMRRYDLIVEEETEYDPKVDASIVNVFSAAAFRFGHSMINGMFKLISQSSRKEVSWLWRLREVFDGQSVKGEALPIENMIAGLLDQAPQTVDEFFTTEISDHLFQKNRRRENFGEDLLSLNIQRGRDHGIPSYNRYRKYCGLRTLSDWNNRPTELSEDYWTKLQSVYNKPDDIDIYVGGIAEQNVRGGVLGPTFACIIGEQFSRLKRGDRFFYTHKRNSRLQTRGLSTVAKNEVLQRTLSDILCDVSLLNSAQTWVTLQPNNDYNPIVFCNTRREMNFREIAKEIERELKGQDAPERVRSGGRSLIPSQRLPTIDNELYHENTPVEENSFDRKPIKSPNQFSTPPPRFKVRPSPSQTRPVIVNIDNFKASPTAPPPRRPLPPTTRRPRTTKRPARRGTTRPTSSFRRRPPLTPASTFTASQQLPSSFFPSFEENSRKGQALFSRPRSGPSSSACLFRLC